MLLADLVAASAWTLVKLAEAVLVSCFGEQNRVVLLTVLARHLIRQSDSQWPRSPQYQQEIRS